MQIPSRFTIAIHILTLIALNKDNETKLTSDFMAGSVGVNPVIIRKTLSQLDFSSKRYRRGRISQIARRNQPSSGLPCC